MNPRDHWEAVYRSKAANQVSWYRPHLEVSLELIKRAAIDSDAAILDVGGGESTLVDDLMASGYRNISVMDISETALKVTKKRLGAVAEGVRWIAGDVTALLLPQHSVDVWHDRAVFHFLMAAEDRAAYVRNVLHCVRPGGHVIIGSFGPEGPERCSGLAVARYDCGSLQRVFGRSFLMVETREELHVTPGSDTQQFVYSRLRVPL
jgi:ubiquinone/menaquinone biosynthesis C-methylase UbiE